MPNSTNMHNYLMNYPSTHYLVAHFDEKAKAC